MRLEGLDGLLRSDDVAPRRRRRHDPAPRVLRQPGPAVGEGLRQGEAGDRRLEGAHGQALGGLGSAVDFLMGSRGRLGAAPAPKKASAKEDGAAKAKAAEAKAAAKAAEAKKAAAKKEADAKAKAEAAAVPKQRIELRTQDLHGG